MKNKILAVRCVQASRRRSRGGTGGGAAEVKSDSLPHCRPAGVIGEYMKNSVEPRSTTSDARWPARRRVTYGDDQVKPDVGKQVAEEMLKRQQVDFVAGIIWSNVMLAVAPTVTDAGKIMVGTTPARTSSPQADAASFSSPPPGRTTTRPRRWAR